MSDDFYKLPHPGIQTLVPYKPGKSIEELRKEQGLKDIIKMASNENPLGCSPLALEALHNMPSSIAATYPSPINHPIMPKLAAQLNIKPDQLFLSNGSDTIYTLLMFCFALNTNKHIMTHEYAFSTYAIQAHTLGIPVRTVAADSNWQFDVEDMIKQCDSQVSLIFIANPNNPTGILIEPNQIYHLLKHIPQNTFLVLDEAYYEFMDPNLYENSIKWLQHHPNLVITRTFSKIYGMAGLRLGYAIAHPVVINLLQRVQLPFSVNQAALTAAYAALDDKEFIELSLKNNAQGIKQMREGLKELNLHHLPTSANFITFHCKEENGLNLYNYLLSRGIIIRPLNPYKMDPYLRVTVGTFEQNKRFLQALKSYYIKESK